MTAMRIRGTGRKGERLDERRNRKKGELRSEHEEEDNRETNCNATSI